MKAIATGNTYSAKDYLKKAGFAWLPARKEWFAENFDIDYWTNKACNATYNGRGNAKICQAIKITKIQ